MYNKILITIILIVVLASSVYRISKSSDDSPAIPVGYSEITDVQGITFYLDDRLIDRATAITQISEESGLDSSNYYVYKNGTDKYIYFNINKVAVIVQKGTSFHFGENENETALQNANICNIWFEKEGKKLEIEKDGNQSIAYVNAALTITKTLYDDFTGKLVTVSDGKEEWAMFAGVPGKSYEMISNSDKKVIDNIIESFHLSSNSEYNSQDNVSEVEEVLPSENEEFNKEELQTEITTENTEEMYCENTLEETIVEEVSDVNEVQPEIEETVHDSYIAADINQKKQNDYGTDVFYSDIYSMLDIGNSGYLTAIDYYSRKQCEPIITIRQILKGSAATNLIKNTLTEYPYFEAKEGCTYHAAIYDVDYSKCENLPYVNIKILGADGKLLKYRGVKYSKRTHDIMSQSTNQNSIISGLICFYEVPNGCKEYVLECGEGSVDNLSSAKSAYYLIRE